MAETKKGEINKNSKSLSAEDVVKIYNDFSRRNFGTRTAASYARVHNEGTSGWMSEIDLKHFEDWFSTYKKGFERLVSQSTQYSDDIKDATRSAGVLKHAIEVQERELEHLRKLGATDDDLDVQIAIEEIKLLKGDLKKQNIELDKLKHDKSLVDDKLYQINVAKNIENLYENSILGHTKVQRYDKDAKEYKTAVDFKRWVPFQKSITNHIESMAKNQAEIRKLEEKAAEIEERRDEQGYLSEEDEENLKNYKEQIAARKQADKESVDFQKMLIGALNKIHSELNESVDAAMQIMGQYLGPISARLQGSGQDFKSIYKVVSSTLTGSPYVSQKKLLENISKFTEAGIAYNIEQRALLATLADRMVSTFNALDASLTRLTRLQRADLTTSSMGVEAQILKLLNERFKDSSYLSDAYDSVSDAILDAMSQVSYEDTAGFTYALQKWLGSLYSIGLSREAVSTIAQGIGYLGTGNVTALSGNTQLQTLLAMSASKAGKSYSELLVSGIDESGVNDLMKAMIEYLQEIATNTEENKVLRSAYGGVFGNLSVADIRAISNLSSADISSIYNSSMSYETALQSTNYQLQQIKARTTVSEKINNALENTLMTFGMGVAENAASYLSWRAGSILVDMGGSIPTIGKYMQIAGAAMKILAGAKGIFDTIKGLGSSIANGMGIEGGFSWSRTIEGVSQSYGITGLYSSDKADKKSVAGVKSNQDVADDIKATKKEVESYEEAIGKGVEDIYDELFEKKTAIMVNIGDNNKKNQEAMKQAVVSIQNAVDTLNGYTENIKSTTAAIKSKLDGNISVDIVNNDVNTLTNAIYSLRNSGSSSFIGRF